MAWSLLHQRYLSIERRPVNHIADALDMPQRTLTYRIARGRAELTEALRAAEAEAEKKARRAETTPEKRASPERWKVKVEQHSQPEVVRRLLELAGVPEQGAPTSMPEQIFDQARRYVDLSVRIDLGEPTA
jgi:hypothetical protein